VLDVGTYDGYWAFELERRGAREVVAIDIDSVAGLDLPAAVRRTMSPAQLDQKIGAGFEIAADVLGSRVTRTVCSVYDLSPERLGRFDLVFCGSLLVHLRDPLLALEKIRSMIGGAGIFVEAFNPGLPMRCAEYKGGRERCVWWAFSRESLHHVFMDAGFGVVELVDVFSFVSLTDHRPVWHAAYRVTR
jgi:tRNA (mo5U34)-methyltransferase